MAPSERNFDKSLLMDLPPELRSEIYEYVASSISDVVITSAGEAAAAARMLVAVSHQVTKSSFQSSLTTSRVKRPDSMPRLIPMALSP